MTHELQRTAAEAPARWGSGLGFTLAAAGSAIGLGNLWGFAYRASQGGGAAFVVLYLLGVLLVGVPLLIAELVLGRSTGHAPVRATAAAGGDVWRGLGWLSVITNTVILSYYVVIAAWVAESLLAALLGTLPASSQAADAYFEDISSGWGVIGGYLATTLCTGLVAAAGVNRGIERLSRWCMPLLFVLLAGLVVWSLGLPGAGEGYGRFLLHWQWREFTDTSTIRNAFSQAFFSLGLGMGSMLTYATYLQPEVRLPPQAVVVAGLDTLVALLAGLAIFPIVASFGLIATSDQGAIGTLFLALPTAFASLGAAGRLMAVVFFLLAYVAAVTSAVSLLEVPVATLIDGFAWRRGAAVWSSVALVSLLALPSALRLDVLESVNDVFGGVLLMVLGLFGSLLMGWCAADRYAADLAASPAPLRLLLLFCLRWVVPVLTAVGLLLSLRDLFTP